MSLHVWVKQRNLATCVLHSVHAMTGGFYPEKTMLFPFRSVSRNWGENDESLIRKLTRHLINDAELNVNKN